MRPLATITVLAKLPPQLERLRELAYNLRWTWDHDTVELFRRLDPAAWEESGGNPVAMLGKLSQDLLDTAARDEAFLAHLDRVYTAYQEYMRGQGTWYRTASGGEAGNAGRTLPPGLRIAYFCAEYGLTESLPIYSGGLGVLAGDHLKSASGLGLPLVGVGLLYGQGYFRQYLNRDGWQGEIYPENDFYTLPVCQQTEPDGTPVTISVTLRGVPTAVRIWRLQVGRVPLVLLDTNDPSNGPAERAVTYRLYSGDLEMRIRQEIVLGIGGIRALEAIGMRPTVCHMNEGHSAFLALERIRLLMQEGLSYEAARWQVAASSVFTVHTPVPAGIDLFPPDLMDMYFGDYYPQLGLSREEFLALGRSNPDNPQEPFSMAVLALKLSQFRNGVSQLHGKVSRRMWQAVWPDLPENEVPITSITNGVHPSTWVSPELAQLYERYLGPRWMEEPDDQLPAWAIDRIPPEELWGIHERQRERLVNFARNRLVQQLIKQGAPAAEVEQAREVLHTDALTIGLARRFATYKRMALLLREPERLQRMLSDHRRPVQIIFSGKAHPQDAPGKEVIRQIAHAARSEALRNHMVFIEDYDMAVARQLVQGVDVWLTTPRRPLEASGTSGMKVALNCGLNVSVLDGWWAEAYQPEIGWAIGRGEEYADPEYQDNVEAAALYDVLEQDVIPLFYDRGRDGLPRAWIARMKAALKALAPFFNTNRMVHEYTMRAYVPAHQRACDLAANDAARARALAEWYERLRRAWPKVRVERVEAETPPSVQVGDSLAVRAWVRLGEISPDDVVVQLCEGAVDSTGVVLEPTTTPMQPREQAADGLVQFEGALTFRRSGRHGYAVRVLPHHPDLPSPSDTGLIRWAE